MSVFNGYREDDDVFYTVARGRKYRSELDILFNLLGLLERREEGIKKTRLLQLANLNTSGFNRYMSLLTGSGLVYQSGGLYRVTSKGRLVRKLLEVLVNMLDSNIIQGVDPGGLCGELEKLGARGCTANYGYLDTAFTMEDVVFGVVFLNCWSNECLHVVSSVVALMFRGNPSSAAQASRTVVLLAGGYDSAAPRRLAPWGNGQVEFWTTGLGRAQQSPGSLARNLIEAGTRILGH